MPRGRPWASSFSPFSVFCCMAAFLALPFVRPHYCFKHHHHHRASFLYKTTSRRRTPVTSSWHGASFLYKTTSRRRIPPTSSCTRLYSSKQPELPAAARPYTKTGDPVESILVVGDGDFSFSANLRSLLPDHITLTTTCLNPNRTALLDQYPKAATSLHLLELNPHTHIGFNVDVTSPSFPFRLPGPSTYSRIIFNFPHVRGKSNIKENRDLLRGFLANAARVLENEKNKKGEILLALCRGQSGVESRTNKNYRASWKLPIYASEAGLVCVGVDKFEYEKLYRPSGHRDGGKTGYVYSTKEPRLYTLVMGGGGGGEGEEGGEARELKPVYGPVWAQELHLWMSPAWLALEKDEVANKVAEAVLACASSMDEQAREWIAGVELEDIYRPQKADDTIVAPSPFPLQESWGFHISYAHLHTHTHTEVLTWEKADALREYIETHIEEYLQGGALLRRGRKTDNHVADVTPRFAPKVFGVE